METSNYTLIKLTASEGCYLTDSADVAIEQRQFAKTIYLAANQSADAWKEISDAEYQQLKAQQDAEMEKTMSQQPTV